MHLVDQSGDWQQLLVGLQLEEHDGTQHGVTALTPIYKKNLNILKQT